MHPKYYGNTDKDYEQWVRDKPCLICSRGSEVHHYYHGRRNAYLSVPLCRIHHSEYHTIGRISFENKYAIKGDWEIIKQLAAYIKELKNGRSETYESAPGLVEEDREASSYREAVFRIRSE